MNGTASPELVDKFSEFLRYGPIGLAGLMLTLVIIGLSIGELSELRERLLRQFMYVGAFCFVVALAANLFSTPGAYPIHFRVLPLDMGSRHKLPMPIIKANSNLVDENMTYIVKSEVTAIVDVSDAINFVENVRAQNVRQAEALHSIVAGSDVVVGQLQKVDQLIDKNCPGGHSGVPAESNAAVLAITSKAASTVAAFKASASDVIDVGRVP